jgi:hypothetical protein
LPGLNPEFSHQHLLKLDEHEFVAGNIPFGFQPDPAVHPSDPIDAVDVIRVKALREQFLPVGLLGAFQSRLLVANHRGQLRIEAQVRVKRLQDGINVLFKDRPELRQAMYYGFINGSEGKTPAKGIRMFVHLICPLVRHVLTRPLSPSTASVFGMNQAEYMIYRKGGILCKRAPISS